MRSTNVPAVQALFAAPQAPLTAVAALLAEQLALPPPSVLLQDHDHGPEPDTAEAVPALHNAPPEGADALVVPLADPQPPATIGAQLGADVIEELTVVLPPVSLLDW